MGALRPERATADGCTPATSPGSTPTATSTRAGRLSDTINRGGEKFGPIEIETVLREHPAVVDVAAAGVPDSEMGERVGVAIVTARPMTSRRGAGVLQGAPRHYKVPEHVVFVDGLPYSETGKVVRRQARRADPVRASRQVLRRGGRHAVRARGAPRRRCARGRVRGRVPRGLDADAWRRTTTPGSSGT